MTAWACLMVTTLMIHFVPQLFHIAIHCTHHCSDGIAMEALLSTNRIALPCATLKRAASRRQPHSRIVRVQASRYALFQA